MSMNDLIHIREAAKRLGVSTATLRRWDSTGQLKAYRTPGNHRAYRESDILAIQGLKISIPHRHLIYARVSSRAQKKHLTNQLQALQTYADAKGYSATETIREVGGGMNFKRPQFLSLMDAIERKEVKVLMIAHKDRLVRFGFEYFDHFCKAHGCVVEILAQESLSPQEEMVQDLLAIVHIFSSRLYGLRRYRKKLEKALK